MQLIKQLNINSQHLCRELPQLGNVESIIRKLDGGVDGLDTKTLKINLLTCDLFDGINILSALLGFSAESLAKSIQHFNCCRIVINKHVNQLVINQQSTLFSNISEVSAQITSASADSHIAIYLKPQIEIEPLDIQLINTKRLTLQNISLYNKIHTFSNVGIVAVAENTGFDEEQLGAFNLFNDAIDYFSAWALETRGPNSEQPWLNSPLIERLQIIPACRVNDKQLLPRYLSNEQQEERLYLIKQQQLNLIDSTLAAVAKLLRQTEIDLTNRLLLSNFEFKNFEVSKKNDEVSMLAENSLSNFQSHFKSIERECKKSSKDRLVGRGYYFQVVESELASLNEESINVEEQNKSHILSFHVDIFEHIKNNIWQHIQHECEKMNESAMETLKEFFNEDKNKIPFITEPEWHDALENMQLDLNMEQHKDYMEIKPRYRGERATRGFFKRLGEGRKSVFMILMTLSIFGSMVGFNYRDYSFMGVIFLTVFLLSFIYTFFAWKKEDKVAMEKEVEKLRDQLHTDFIRVIGEIERENTREFNEQLRQFKELLVQKNQDMNKKNTDITKDLLLAEKRLMSEKESSIKRSLSKVSEQLNQVQDYIKEVNDLKTANVTHSEINFG
jgi:hypothetical protein